MKNDNSLVEINAEKFNEFLIEVFPKHHDSTAFEFLNYINHKKFHRLDAVQKAYLNEILEIYYGIHYAGIANQNNGNVESYNFKITNRKLCAFLKIKYGL